MIYLRFLASMGPQLDSCGRLNRRLDRYENVNVLQWGRNLIVAEGTGLLLARFKTAPASMGPQLDSCGRNAALDALAGHHELQWGRNLIVAEGCFSISTILAPWSFNGAAT